MLEGEEIDYWELFGIYLYLLKFVCFCSMLVLFGGGGGGFGGSFG